NKKAKSSLDSFYLWHCRLAHIDKKHITKLQKDGILKSTDNEPDDKCESCISGKMTKKPFSHKTEKVNDVLRLIHTDVYGPLRHVSKKGASYFITFTDDYSRYGYVYLLKHKYEVFETFKDYALETTARILNIVSTKKVDKTPYKLWHGKVPNLSYLKVKGKLRVVNTLTLPRPRSLNHKRKSIWQKKDNVTTARSSKQSTTAQHAAEAEYIATAESAKETVWIRKFVDELGVVPSYNYPIEMNCDNIAAISMAKEPGIMKGARHFQRKFHYVRECVDTGEIEMVKVHTDDNLADPFTKALAGPKLTRHARSMGVRPANDEDTIPSENTSKHTIEAESLALIIEEDVVPVRRFARTPQAPNRLCLNVEIVPDQLYFNVEVEEHSLGDKGEPNKRFDEEIKKFGFHQNLDEPCVYQKASGSNVIFLILYVDDIILMGNHKPSLQKVKDYLDDKARMQNVPYASAVASMMYAVRCTRPDVVFAQNITSRFQQSPSEAHWTVVKNILKYLRRTKDMFLVYDGNSDAELQVKCYCDAGFETDRDDTKSQTGDFVFETKDGAEMIRHYMQTSAPQQKVKSNVIDTFSLILNHEQKMNSNGNKIKYFSHTTMIVKKNMFQWKKENEEYDEEKQFEAFLKTIKSEFIKDPEMKNMKDLEMAFFPIIAHEHYYLVVFNFLKGNTVISTTKKQR
nr:retrotransposon protein, putative, Ty1-copia subclass [Tanacetum cinerariifolium]